MSLYVYAPKLTAGVLDLIRALGGSRLRQYDGLDFWAHGKRIRLVEGDTVVCWGGSVPELDGMKVLNGTENPLRSRMEELDKMGLKGLRTVTLYRHAVKTPITLDIPRKLRLVSDGYDLVLSPSMPETYVLWENFSREYRVHSFNNRVILYGVKAPREGFKTVGEKDWVPDQDLTHSWIRSKRTGWKVGYILQTDPAVRKLAHAAIDALEVTFGAVDIAERAIDGRLVVLGVNKAPELDSETIPAYVKAINKWVEGKKQDNYEAGRDGAGEPEANPF